MRRFLLVPVLAVLAAAPALAQAPACAVAPGALRAAAQGADAEAQARAIRLVNVGEQLCEARNRVAAERKFKEAAKALKLDYAQLQQPAAAAQ